METSTMIKRLKVYQITSIITILLTLVGFSYNVYRLEQSELNSNIRTSSFEMLKELANLEKIVYAAHYDKDTKLGNPRNGWVKVGVITDLSIICFGTNNNKTDDLKKTWKDNWSTMAQNQESATKIVKSIDKLRIEIRKVLQNLN